MMYSQSVDLVQLGQVLRSKEAVLQAFGDYDFVCGLAHIQDISSD